MLKLNPQKKDLFWGAVFVYLTPKHLQCYLQLKFPSSGIFSFSLVHKLITLFSGLLNVDLILHTHTHSQNVMLLLSRHSHLRTARSVAHERPFLVWVHHSCHLLINYRKKPIHTDTHTCTQRQNIRRGSGWITVSLPASMRKNILIVLRLTLYCQSFWNICASNAVFSHYSNLVFT